MKPFIHWSTLSVLLFVLTAAGLHGYLSLTPTKILVAVDSSFAMKTKWSQVQKQLVSLSNSQPYASFALATDKSLVHSWDKGLTLGMTLAYGPRNLNKFTNDFYLSEISEADEKILITNDKSALDQLTAKGWKIIKL